MRKNQKLKELGLKIRNARLEKKLSQGGLGNLVDKDRQNISRLELGNVNPSYLLLLEICEGLEISLQELLDVEV